MNAFDLISFSTGLDMSGLFEDPTGSNSVERVVSTVVPEKIMERVEAMTEEGRVVVRREKNGGVY